MNTVVIVDNDSKWIVNYKRMLASFQEEMDCRYFRQPEEAIEYISTHPTAVLVSELDMPVMSGRELFEMMDMLSPATVKIAITQVRDVAKTLEIINQSQIFKLILKPFFLVEDIAVPIQEGLKHYRVKEQEKEFRQKAEQELEKLNQRTEELFKKLKEKKQGYDRICHVAAGIMEKNLSSQVSGFEPEEGKIIGDFCEKLLQEFVQYYMYEKRNFIFHMNYLKNQFHQPGKSCIFQIYNKTGGEIPAAVMNRMAYGIFLVGCLCSQLQKSYHAENVIEKEGGYYVLKVVSYPPENAEDGKIASPGVRKLLRRMVGELGRAMSDYITGDSRVQGRTAKLYFRWKEERQ